MKYKIVLVTKELGSENENKKARLVAQAIESEDTKENMFIIYSPTFTRASVRLILFIGMRNKMDIFLCDISKHARQRTENFLETYVQFRRQN